MVVSVVLVVVVLRVVVWLAVLLWLLASVTVLVLRAVSRRVAALVLCEAGLMVWVRVMAV